MFVLSDTLNVREQEILNVIRSNILQRGYPPSVREIGQQVGLSSSSTVHTYLKRLEDKGFIRRDPTKPRAIEILDNRHHTDKLNLAEDEQLLEVPLVGKVAAGSPLLAVENIEEILTLPRSFAGFGELFMLKVQGQSMIDAGILEGDLILVRKQPSAVDGEIVVAMVDGEATVKRFFKEKDHIRLQPENKNMAPIIVRDVQILGKVVGLMRKI